MSSSAGRELDLAFQEKRTEFTTVGRLILNSGMFPAWRRVESGGPGVGEVDSQIYLFPNKFK